MATEIRVPVTPAEEVRRRLLGDGARFKGLEQLLQESFAEVAAQLADLVEEVRASQLKPYEFSGFGVRAVLYVGPRARVADVASAAVASKTEEGQTITVSVKSQPVEPGLPIGYFPAGTKFLVSAFEAPAPKGEKQ